MHGLTYWRQTLSGRRRGGNGHERPVGYQSRGWENAGGVKLPARGGKNREDEGSEILFVPRKNRSPNILALRKIPYKQINNTNGSSLY